ncbi:non-ribosomal peptide synthetase [Paenibacillus tepidiphilus]|uniref:non-ribosomal peptide synthetase n=1 Tax=Paenibacillus tepidiphilus TaxID=2608683 RepID=UPI0012386ADE|nr:non-ribosomal peptide synthetase [Paenibacillus tepidiphilus]
MGSMTKQKRKYTIPAVSEQGLTAPLSFQQERLYYLSRLLEDSPLWNRVSVRRLTGQLDLPALQGAVKMLVKRHAALRSAVHWEDKELFQSFRDERGGRLTVSVLDASPEEPKGEAVDRMLKEEWRLPIRPDKKDALFQARLVQTGEEEYYLILKLHHIISDATTFQILWRDLKVFYNTLADGMVRELPELKLDYGDYARWQREAFNDGNTLEQERYWKNSFGGDLPILDLPCDYPAPSQTSFRGAVTGLELPEPLLKRLAGICMKNQAIPFSGLLAVYQALLHKCTRQEDIIVGTVFNGRHYSKELAQMAGFFVNTVAIRQQVTEGMTFMELLGAVQQKVNEAYDMQDYPFERLIQALNPERSGAGGPLYRAMFNMVTKRREEWEFTGLSEEAVATEGEAAQTDLLFDVREDESRTMLYAEYNTDLFRESTVRHLLEMYVLLLEQIAERPDIQLQELSLASERDKRMILHAFNNTEAAHDDLCLHQLFASSAAVRPEQTALQFKGTSMTYGELNAAAGRLASFLRMNGVGRESMVAVIGERCIETVVGIYAILQAGGTVLPIDPATPRERVRYILADSGAVHALVQKPEFGDIAAGPAKIIPIADLSVYEEGPYANDNINSSSDLAYCIYTSGSTGTPKGVMLEHRSIVNTLTHLQRSYPLLGGDAHLFKTAYTFDVSIAELFGWFHDGGRLVILEPGLEKDPQGIMDAIVDHHVTHVNFSPSMLGTFLEATEKRDAAEWDGVKVVFSVGEALKPYVVKRFFDRVHGTRLENMYGPTETAIYAVIHSAGPQDAEAAVPIGRPVSNMRVYITDSQLQLLPPGIPGELCLAGLGVGRGYLNQPGLTQEKFMNDPFVPGERLYRTGDLARWREDGTLEYLGRMDQQVKVRGFRIEPGEVEHTLLKHPAVRRAVVQVREDEAGQQRLVAYMVLAEQGQEGQWQEFLAQWLPAYMIPGAYVILDAIPLNTNGKVDYRSLPAPAAGLAEGTGNDRVLTYVEQKLIEITEEVLHLQGISINDNFFNLGGNSLLTIRFVTEIEEAFGISVSLLDFFDLPVLSDLARMIEPLVQASAV